MIYSEKAIKAAVSSFPPEAWTSLDKQESKVAELVSQVSWLYSIEHWRAGAMSGLPIELQRNGDKIERADWPVDMNLPDLLYRYSLAMDLYGASYLFQVMQGSRIVEVKWFDPQTISIEANERVGLVGFTRTLGANKQTYPVKNGRSRVMWTWLPGMAEVAPGDPPANVVKDAAETLRYMSRTTRGFFEKGAIDNWVLFGPQSAIPEPQRAGFIKWWRRVMMGGSTTQGSMEVLHPDSRLERISSDPGAWILPELNDMNAENIAMAHQTPLMLLRPEQGSDKAMMDRVTLSWINGVIIPQAQRVIDTLNYQLFDDLGYELVIMAESMNVNQEEEVLKAQAVAQYVAAGETLANAYRILGIDLPDDYEVAPDEPEPEPMPLQPQPEQLQQPPELEQNVLRAIDARAVRTWIKKRPDADLNDFKSNHLTLADRQSIAYEVSKAQDAPFPGDDRSIGGKATDTRPTRYP